MGPEWGRMACPEWRSIPFPELSYTCIFPGAGDRYLISYFRVGLSGFRIGNTDGLSDFIDQPGATFV